MKKSHLPNKSGFKVPKDYLNSFEERLNTQLFLDDKKDAGFKLPDNYLSDFKVEIPKGEKTPKVISLFNRKTLLTIASIAATITLLFTLTLNKKRLTVNDIETELLNTYVLTELETEDFSTLLEDVSLSETDFIELENENLNQVINNLDLDDIIQD